MALDLEEECDCAVQDGGSPSDRDYKQLVIALLCQIAGYLSTIATNTTPEPPPP